MTQHGIDGSVAPGSSTAGIRAADETNDTSEFSEMMSFFDKNVSAGRGEGHTLQQPDGWLGMDDFV